MPTMAILIRPISLPRIARALRSPATSSVPGPCAPPPEILEHQRLPLHPRQARLGPDVAEAEHPRPVGHDGDAVAPVRVLVDEIGPRPRRPRTRGGPGGG